MGDHIIVKNLHLALSIFVVAHHTMTSIAVDTTKHIYNKYDCAVTVDVIYGGSVADCSDKNLCSADLSLLYFKETITTLILSNNNIGVLANNSLSRLTHIRRLECALCNLNVIQLDAFFGLTQLEILNLEVNNLPIVKYRFPKGLFKNVPLLKELFIQNNQNYGLSENYSTYLDIFDASQGLTHLTLDSFYNLRAGSEFCKLKNLTNLAIYTHRIESISNDSLKGFECSNVKEFVLNRGTIRDHSLLGLGVFRFLPVNTNSLIINSLHIGNLNMLAMMKPLRGRTFQKIYFIGVDLSLKASSLSERALDAIVTQNAMEHLSSMCVSEFAWLESDIFSFDTNSLFSPTWCRCLQVAALESSFDVDASRGSMNKIFELKNIRSIITSSRSMGKLTNQFLNGVGISRYVDGARENNTGTLYYRSTYSGEKEYKQLDTSKVTRDQSRYNYNYYHRHHKPQQIDEPVIQNTYVSLPPLLQTLDMNGIHSTGINDVIYFRENSLTSITITNCYRGTGLSLTGKMIGLNLLQSINLQDSKVTIALDFFDTFPNITKLILRNIQNTAEPASQFLENNSQRLLQNVATQLEYLDLSDNELLTFPSNRFRNLKLLSLSSNDLSRIPVDFKMTPALQILDLRDNLFGHLSEADRQSIDDHIVHVENFTIVFTGNRLSCSCTNVPFIVWLQHRLNHFDQEGNYSCMSEDGRLAYTAQYYKDTAALWRQCQGRGSLLLSLTLLFILVSGYLGMFLIMKNRIQITSRIRQMMVPGFRVMTREDFRFDVCIGYADQDGNYVRDVLLMYLEDQWRLRTFVHQRDLLQDPLLMSEAIRDSWRCLLLITRNFLSRCEMAHNVMKVASFFVSPNNPDSLVVMVEDEIAHLIPDYVLQVVNEDNIIVVPGLERWLSYQDKEALRTRLQ